MAPEATTVLWTEVADTGFLEMERSTFCTEVVNEVPICTLDPDSWLLSKRPFLKDATNNLASLTPPLPEGRPGREKAEN